MNQTKHNTICGVTIQFLIANFLKKIPKKHTIMRFESNQFLSFLKTTTFKHANFQILRLIQMMLL